MKQLIRLSIFVIMWSMSVINISAEEVIIESISLGNDNPWDNRPLIQATTYDEEYCGAVRLGAFTMPEIIDKKEDRLYEEASGCVVRIVMGQYAGSGLIWRMEEDGMVLVTNKHLLRESAYGIVTFSNEMALQAEVLYFSQEYDLGFLFIPREVLHADILRNCYEVRKTKEGIKQTGEQLEEQKIIQIASSQQVAADCYKGTSKKIVFVPEFQAFMLETECFSKAGMSGGGVFDEKGYLIAMIAGGEVDKDDLVRESEITYSIPVWQIEDEYHKLRLLEMEG